MEAVDESYWKAMRGLEEAAMLLEKTSAELQASNEAVAAKLFDSEAQKTREQAKKLRETVLSGKLFSGDSLLEKAEKDKGR